jgi:O-antigen ligase
MTLAAFPKLPMQLSHQPIYVKWALASIIVFTLALFRSVAATNLAVLCLLFAVPFAWRDFLVKKCSLDSCELKFLGLILLFCAWDVVTNLIAGHEIFASMEAMWHDLRTLGFVVVFWVLFCNPYISRVALISMFSFIVLWAAINLFLRIIGSVPEGKYFCNSCSHLSHMYGQALVGVFFVLAQCWISRPRLLWRLAVPMALLLLSLFLASERRTGYVMLVLGFVVWGALNAKHLLQGKFKWLFMLAFIGAFCLAASSGVVQKRMTMALSEVTQYISMTPHERLGSDGAVAIRLQFYTSVIELIRQSNAWIGVGSLSFSDLYRNLVMNMGVSSEIAEGYNWSNPHNEYLFMLATKGIVGLTLYIAIFIQACRLAWLKTDEVQRVGLLIFIFLFMLSITSNSMMVDMEEGHFTMLILLVFLAPKSLNLFSTNTIEKTKK